MKGIFSYTCWEEEVSVKFIRYFLVYIIFILSKATQNITKNKTTATIKTKKDDMHFYTYYNNVTRQCQTFTQLSLTFDRCLKRVPRCLQSQKHYQKGCLHCVLYNVHNVVTLFYYCFYSFDECRRLFTNNKYHSGSRESYPKLFYISAR